MGFGSYSAADWGRLKTSSSITERSTANELFKAHSMPEKFDPKFINVREARDNDDHPNSTPVIVGLDVTGSMGYLSAEIAKNGLHETMMKIYSTKPIEDPQLMFAAIGDVTDRAPLQVTQFESDIRIAEQLLELWLEGAGGDAPEDFELLWYFAAKHTSTDCFEKRGKKGFIFTIGDADIHPMLNDSDIEAIFKDKSETLYTKEIAKMAKEKYELIHIHINKNNMLTLPSNFNEIIPGRILPVNKDSISFIPEIIISAMQIINGEDKNKVVAQWSDLAKPVVKEAVSYLKIEKAKKGIFF